MFIDLKNCAALLLLPYLLRERESHVVFFDENIQQPRTVCGFTAEADLPKIIKPATKSEIKIEDVTTGYNIDFVKEFGIMLLAYYVFNVAYAERVESSMQLIQKLLLGLSDGVNVPAKVLSLTATIKKVIALI